MNVTSDLATGPIASATKRTEMVGHTCTPAFREWRSKDGPPALPLFGPQLPALIYKSAGQGSIPATGEGHRSVEHSMGNAIRVQYLDVFFESCVIIGGIRADYGGRA